MRLLIAVLSPGTARRIAAGMEIRGFDALIAPNGTQALKLLSRERFCLLYTSPSPRDRQKSRMPSSA